MNIPSQKTSKLLIFFRMKYFVEKKITRIVLEAQKTFRLHFPSQNIEIDNLFIKYLFS